MTEEPFKNSTTDTASGMHLPKLGSNKPHQETHIKLQYYERPSCDNGCCIISGYDVFVDGKKIGETNDIEALVELLNETFNTNEK
jgi:hypothetical protein